MDNLEDCKSLEEKMFYLGSHCMPLPKEPEAISREYYNLGIETYRRVMDMRNDKTAINLGKSLLDMKNFQSNEEFKGFVEENYQKIKDKYEKINEILSDESLGKIAKSAAAEQIKDWVHINYQIIKGEFHGFYGKYLSINHGQ